MPRFTRGLVVSLVVLVLGSFVVMLQQKPASGAPGPAPVTVTNTPLPTTVTNTPLPVSGSVAATVSGNVNVGNFPATQNVSGNVGVSGPVSISSFPGLPIFVEPDAFAAHQPDETNCSFGGPISMFQDGQNFCAFGSQPGGNRVVDNFSLEVKVGVGTIVENAFLGFGSSAGQIVPLLFTSLTKMGSSGIFDYYVGAQQGHVYLQSSTAACVVTTFAPNGNGEISMQCTINGHDVPPS